MSKAKRGKWTNRRSEGRWREEKTRDRSWKKSFLFKDPCMQVYYTYLSLCEHVGARCPHLSAHLQAEPCQTTNQAIHHRSTCHRPLLASAHVHVYAATVCVRKCAKERTINKLISTKTSILVVPHQGQTSRTHRNANICSWALPCNYAPAKK